MLATTEFTTKVAGGNGHKPKDLDIKLYLDRAEAGDAELFALHFKNKFVYDRSTKTWFIWQGHYWEEDKLGAVRRAVITTVAGDYAQASANALKEGSAEMAEEFYKRSRLLMTKKRADSVLSLVTDIPGMSITGDEWDQQPMLLAATNGVINLETRKLQAGEPRLYMRCHVSCDYRPGEYSPEWDKFISEFCEGIVMELGGDQLQMIKFMRRLLGYFITGQVSEKILPIMWGEHGYNGRTTLQEALRSVLGDDFMYTVSADVLMTSKSDRSGPQPHLYALRGKRVIFAAESKDDQRIDSGFVKQLTGMDSFKTHGKYTGIITVNPSFKTALLTNKKPRIDVDDDALWRRILLIPFGISYVPEPSKPYERKADKQLGEKLRQAGPAILAWLVTGAWEWKMEGLNPPTELLAATHEYRNEEDVVQQFIEDCLILNAPSNTLAAQVYEKYVAWSNANGLKPMANNSLGKRLKQLIGEPKRSGKGMVYEGVMPKTNQGSV